MSDNLSAEKAIERLKKGNKRFVDGKMTHPRQDAKRRKELTEGQWPFCTILGCADSRVPPAIVFDEGLGDLFVNRVAGNVAPASIIASIEYSVAHLGVKLIVVLGHEACGAVKAARDGGDNGYNLNILLSYLTAAVAETCGQKVEATVRANARIQCGYLLEQSQIIQDAVKNKGLKIVPAYYHLESGKVDFNQ